MVRRAHSSISGCECPCADGCFFHPHQNVVDAIRTGTSSSHKPALLCSSPELSYADMFTVLSYGTGNRGGRRLAERLQSFMRRVLHGGKCMRVIGDAIFLILFFFMLAVWLFFWAAMHVTEVRYTSPGDCFDIAGAPSGARPQRSIISNVEADGPHEVESVAAGDNAGMHR